MILVVFFNFNDSMILWKDMKNDLPIIHFSNRKKKVFYSLTNWLSLKAVISGETSDGFKYLGLKYGSAQIWASTTLNK